MCQEGPDGADMRDVAVDRAILAEEQAQCRGRTDEANSADRTERSPKKNGRRERRGR
jgi:hypothetical protein